MTEHKPEERDILYPKDTLEGRSNYKRYFYIDRDGSRSERVYLNILDKRQREEIVCKHFLQFSVRYLLKEDTGVNIISRDDPWDFRIELSSGGVFNLEIVSIADNELQFKVFAREEELDKTAYAEHIPLRQLQKFAEVFPNEELDKLIADHKTEGRHLDDLIANPYHQQHKKIFVSVSQPPKSSFGERLDKAIASKEAKRHPDKQNTILIVDNRTAILCVDEVTDALDAMSERFDSSPFQEIWFYNGYCSDHDGNNGQFTFISIKATPETLEAFHGERRNRKDLSIL